ncbi:hypothetical protein BC008_41335 [Mastigocoleus testarum BC008]|uniref:Uncharacterized protein n=1 Tax=Mastigocoleus testarum BC008 TaxID=371196 RepID=A0A0V7ZJF0_9CYAN|nr:hypothetical protein BC008_40360 [Mastigocoleus testarum BC008]KST64761.1 hypothetical protein BC008_41335 [Mastigocoleus testarum BC008]
MLLIDAPHPIEGWGFLIFITCKASNATKWLDLTTHNAVFTAMFDLPYIPYRGMGYSVVLINSNPVSFNNVRAFTLLKYFWGN